MEKEQEQKIQISGWRDLTAKQMAVLLQYFTANKSGQLYQESSFLRTTIKENDQKALKDLRALKGSGQKSPPYIVNGFPGGPVVYFLTVVAAINEKAEGTDLQKAEMMKRLAEKYRLDVFCKFGSDDPEKYNFEYYIGQIVPGQNESATKRAAECWKRILGYLNGVDAPGPLWKVGEIFQWLYNKNIGANAQSDLYGNPVVPSENLMDSYGKCCEILDRWWEQKNKEGKPYGEHLWHCLMSYFQQTQQVEQADSTFVKRAKRRIENGVKQIIFTGAPGTGKTYAARRIAESMGTPLPSGGQKSRRYIQVQFHPSYDYTDFVEGLRPVQAGGPDGGGKLDFFKLDGHFKAFCRMVAEANEKDEKQKVEWEEKKYFFLIDEINRAELSKVFGELMYCLEADKRGPGNRVQTQYQSLPTYDLKKGGVLTADEDIFSKGFYIPANVIVIGTMNDIDRSVESMDFAMRRRFEWMEFIVNGEMLEGAFRNFGGELAAHSKALAESVSRLNGAIEEKGRPYDLNRQYFISQGQFANLPAGMSDLEEIKKYVWESRIEPLLREYLRGESGVKEFVEACENEFFKPDIEG